MIEKSVDYSMKLFVQAVAFSAVAIVFVLAGESRATTFNVPSPFSTIQAAVNAASSGDTVLVANGTYTGAGNRDISPGGKNIVIRSSGGSAVCVIDCGGSSGAPHRGFLFANSETSAMKLEGFTIKNGYAPLYVAIVGIDTLSLMAGGAVACDGASPTFRDILFSNNTSELGGAVVCILGSNADFRDCEFKDNSTFFGLADDGDGGALFAFESNLTISNCRFVGNHSVFDGGAISADTDSGNSMQLDSCFFGYNVGDSGAGAIAIFGVELQASNSVFTGNSSGFIGGAILLNGNSVPHTSTLTNCTIVGNTLTGNGAGTAIFLEQEADAVLTRCIVSDNGGVANNFALHCESASTTYSISCTNMWNNLDGDWESCVFGLGAINGNFSSDPMYCLTDSTDFSIDVKSQSAAANNSCGLLIGAKATACDVPVTCCVVPGDFNHDGIFNIADLTSSIDRVFTGGGPPFCQDEADSNSDNVFNIVDITFNISRIFTGGGPPICGTTGS